MKVSDAIQDIEECKRLLQNLDKLDKLNEPPQRKLEEIMAEAECNTAWVNFSGRIRLIVSKYKSNLENQIDEAEIEGI